MFLLISLVMILLSGCRNNYQEKLANKSIGYSNLIMELLVQKINDKMENVENNTEELVFSELLQKGLNSYSDMSIQDKTEFKKKIQNEFIMKYSYYFKPKDVKLVSNSGEIICSINDKELKSEEVNKLIADTSQSINRKIWTTMNSNNNNSIIFCQSVKNLLNGQVLATIIVEFDNTSISNIYNNLIFGEGQEIFIIDSKNTIISSKSSKLPIGKEYAEKDIIQKISLNANKQDRYFVSMINNEKFVVFFSKINGTEWTIVAVIPYKSFTVY